MNDPSPEASYDAVTPPVCRLDGVRVIGEEGRLEDVSLEIAAGEVFGILADRTRVAGSLLRLLAGARRPDAGAVTVFGEDPVDAGDDTRSRVGVRLLPVQFLRHSPVGEIVREFAGLYGREDAGGLLEHFDLEARFGEPADSLPRAEAHLLSLALATLHEPELLLVENPSQELDPRRRRRFWDWVATASEAGTTVIFSTPFPGETHLCHRVAILHDGRVRASGSPAELLDRYARGFVVEFRADREIDAEQLDRIGDVQRVDVMGAEFRLQVRDLAGVADVARRLAEAELGVHDFRTRPARLEEIFLVLAEAEEDG